MRKNGYVISLLVSLLLGCGPERSRVALEISLPEQREGILGGIETPKDFGYAKYVVLIYDRLTRNFCTGMLIKKNVILTAAHCVKNPAASLNLAFGAKPLSGAYVMRDALKTVIHPEYNPTAEIKSNRHDLALILMSSEAPEGYEPLHLPTSEQVFTVGDFFTAAGYGRVSGIVTPKDPSNFQGAGTLRHVELAVKEFSTNNLDFTVEQTEGKGICQGDSGGPAIKTYNGQDYAMGVASAISWVVPGSLTDEEKSRYAEFNDICRQESIYMNVQSYHEWITTTLQSLIQ